MPTVARSAFFALLSAAVGCAGDATAPCSPADPCADKERCVAGVCRLAGESLAPERSRRVVLLARDVAVLSSTDRVTAEAAVTPFGARAAGEVIVLLHFDGAIGENADLASAFLVLDPDLASPGPTSAILVEAAEVLGPWANPSSGDGLSWGRSPRIGPVVGSASVPPARRAPIRIDVTRSIARAHGTGFGLALRASGKDAHGARFITAAGDAAGPRLELYLK